MATPMIPCVVDPAVPPMELALLDDLMSDPTKWPKTIWGVLKPQALTPAARRWGAVETGHDWLTRHGYTFTRYEVLRHYKQHVPFTMVDLDKLGEMALELHGNSVTPYRGAQAVVGYYEKAIALGMRSIDLLQKRLDAYRDAGEEPDERLLLEMMELGGKMASSAAVLAIRGGSPMGREDDPWEGARPVISDHVAHGRIRVIDGDRRYVKDEGPADRADYTAKAAAEGRESPF